MEDILSTVEKNIASCEDDLARLTKIRQHIVSVRERFSEGLENLKKSQGHYDEEKASTLSIQEEIQLRADKHKEEIKPETFTSQENLVIRLIKEDIIISDGKWKAWVKDGKYYMSTFLEDENSYLDFKDCFHNFNEWFITLPKEPEVMESKISFQSEEQIYEFLFESPANQVTDGTVILRVVNGQPIARSIHEDIGVVYSLGSPRKLFIKDPSAWRKYVSDKI